MTEVKLKPCPFCGDEPNLRLPDAVLNKPFVVCVNKKCWSYSLVADDVKQWNTRARTAIEAKAFELLRKLDSSACLPKELRLEIFNFLRETS